MNNNNKDNNNNNNNEMNNNYNNNNNDNNNINLANKIFTDDCKYDDISNMIYPSQAELNGKEDSRLSLSYSKECPEMSLMTEEELPQEIHIHSLTKTPLSEEICAICNKKKTCSKSYKCNLCPLRICDKCVYPLYTHFYSNEKHMHPLILKEIENYKCNECKRRNFKNNFCFYCDRCNVGVCLDCYIPPEKDEDKDYIHEHLLISENNITSIYCKLCGEEKKDGYKCNNCEMELCNKCFNNILSHKRRNNLHEHKLLLCVRDNWGCNSCKKYNLGKISFFCKECNLDYCLNCFLE